MKYLLGKEVVKSKRGITISRRKYTIDLLEETGMLGKPAKTPMDSNYKIGFKKESTPVDKRFQRLVGKLIYLSHTRLDISFPFNVVNQHMNKPIEELMEAVYRILRYLKMEPGKGIFSRRVEIEKFKCIHMLIK